MSHCADCACWITHKKRLFASAAFLDGLAPEGQGICRGPLNGVAVPPAFGCIAFVPGSEHIDVQDFRPLDVYESWEMIPCPDCGGKGVNQDVPDHPANSTMGFSACSGKCAGTGNVRRYADGHVADERIRMHPLEAAKIRAEKEAALKADLERQISELDKPPAPPEADKSLPFA